MMIRCGRFRVSVTPIGRRHPKPTCRAVHSRNNRWPLDVTLVEVGPRDGLQNEPSAVPAAVKVRQYVAIAEW